MSWSTTTMSRHHADEHAIVRVRAYLDSAMFAGSSRRVRYLMARGRHRSHNLTDAIESLPSGLHRFPNTRSITTFFRDAAEEEMMITPLIIQQTMPGSCGDMICRAVRQPETSRSLLHESDVSYLNPRCAPSSPARDVLLSTADGHGEAHPQLPGRGRRVFVTSSTKILVSRSTAATGLWQPGPHRRRTPTRGCSSSIFIRDIWIGLHVNVRWPDASRTRSCWPAPMSPRPAAADMSLDGGRRPERWCWSRSKRR